MVYVNILRNPRAMLNLVVRSERPSLALVGAVREAIWSVDPQQTITRVTSLEQIVDDTLAAPRLITSAMVLFGGLGLLLGAVGIYGVLAYLVGQRRRELGIRLALGATQGNLLRWVLGRGVRLAALGVTAETLRAE